MKKPDKFEETILFLANKLKGKKYAIRGTASLVLQGLDMNADDIDIVCDRKTAMDCNKIFKDYLIEKVSYKELEKYKSYFGKFKINGIDMEVMGDWQIKMKKGLASSKRSGDGWSQIFDGKERKEIVLNSKKIWVTTIDSELKMFAAMGRWNAYWKIKRQISHS
jgi:hypothetical protein